MPGGDIDGFDSSPGSHDHAQGSTLLNQWGHASFIQRWLCLSSVQAALGASDRGEVQEQAEMSSDPLAVDQNQIRLRLQFGKGFYQNRCFPEGKEAGDVGKRGLPLNHGAFEESQIRIGEEEEGSVYPVIRTAVRDIPGTDFFPRNFRWREDYFLTQPLLVLDSPPGADVPGMGKSRSSTLVPRCSFQSLLPGL